MGMPWNRCMSVTQIFFLVKPKIIYVSESFSVMQRKETPVTCDKVGHLKTFFSTNVQKVLFSKLGSLRRNKLGCGAMVSLFAMKEMLTYNSVITWQCLVAGMSKDVEALQNKTRRK